jgi:hypothetical protein
MNRTLATTVLLSAAALLAALALAAPAGANSRQVSIMQDDSQVLRSGPVMRRRTLDEFRNLGADVVKVSVAWNDLAPRRPRHPSDPNAYPWNKYEADYDDVVRAAGERGLRVYLGLVGHRAPRWAAGRLGVTRPSARQLRYFAEAAGRHFSGSLDVPIWSIWNEPHLFTFIRPQRSRSGTPLSPSIYRRLYLAGVAGLRASGHGGDRILFGELAPFGAGVSYRVGPIDFIREMACLDRRFRPYRGRARRARGCPSRMGRIPTSGLAYHPYTLKNGPRYRLPRSGDATIAQLSRVTRVLDGVARRGRLPRRLPIWITEFGFQTDPPDPFQGVFVGRAPAYMDESEWIAYRNPRVVSYSQYQLTDDGPRRGSRLRRWEGWQSGLYTYRGRKKPKVYKAWQMPAFARVRRGGVVEVFGGLRDLSAFGFPYMPGGTPVRIESKVGAGGSYRRHGGASLNSAGYFRRFIRVSSPTRRYFRITILGRTRVKRALRR